MFEFPTYPFYRIPALDPLSGLINLQVLYVANDKIEDISVLSELSNLQVIDLSGNDEITSTTYRNNIFAGYEPLKVLPKLKTLYFDNFQMRLSYQLGKDFNGCNIIENNDYFTHSLFR